MANPYTQISIILMKLSEKIQISENIFFFEIHICHMCNVYIQPSFYINRLHTHIRLCIHTYMLTIHTYMHKHFYNAMRKWMFTYTSTPELTNMHAQTYDEI